MKRGEIWTVAGGGDYTGKPRPAVILQDDRFDATESITVCGLTTDPTDVPFVRVRIEPSATTGLSEVSRALVDKITTVRRSRLHEHLGQLSAADMTALERAILVFLGFAAGPRRGEPAESADEENSEPD